MSEYKTNIDEPIQYLKDYGGSIHDLSDSINIDTHDAELAMKNYVMDVLKEILDNDNANPYYYEDAVKKKITSIEEYLTSKGINL